MLENYNKKIGTDEAEYQDMELKCVEENCQLIFQFTAGEQKFYADHGYENVPKRCPDCRKARKVQLGSRK